MAAGDITRDTGSPVTVGSQWLLAGTIEVDDTPRAYALGGTGIRIVSCFVQDEDGVGSAHVRINENTAGTTTNGTVHVFGNSKTVQTYRYECRYA